MTEFCILAPMKGLILSGGAGTRLRPITHTSAKQLVPIANKPILFYGIEGLVDAGITEIGIIIGETGAEVREAVGDGSHWGVSITYIPQDAPLGLAHCVRIAQNFLGNDDFAMYLGDNMLEQNLADLINSFRSNRANGGLDCRILLKEVADPSSFGVALVDTNGHVTDLVEKPQNPSSNLALVGVYFFTNAIHQAVAAIKPSARGELEITDAIQWLIEQGLNVDHDILEGWWIDTGKKDPLLECNRLVLGTIGPLIDRNAAISSDSTIEGSVQVGRQSSITGSTIIGPVVIGNNVTIENCQIGPYASIGDGCTLSAAALDDSVLLKNCSLFQSGRITSSLLGRSSSITGTSPSATTSLMLGDDSVVDLR
jgi:glucose-1-phosphate thymidylyltransferase